MPGNTCFGAAGSEGSWGQRRAPRRLPVIFTGVEMYQFSLLRRHLQRAGHIRLLNVGLIGTMELFCQGGLDAPWQCGSDRDKEAQRGLAYLRSLFREAASCPAPRC